MSDTIEAAGASIELPSKGELEQRMTVVEQHGVTTELRCGECDDLTEATALPEESIDVTICRSCATEHLRSAAFL